MLTLPPWNCRHSKHILNAQVAIRAPCCRRFFDCPQCHAEAVGSEHKLAKTTEMQMVCKKCRRAFRKDLARFEHEDEFCPHCDNHFVRLRRRRQRQDVATQQI